MPFDGYPVFQLSPRDVSVKIRRSSRRLPRPSKASDSTTPRRACTEHRPARAGALAAASPPATRLAHPEGFASRTFAETHGNLPERSLLFSAKSRENPFPPFDRTPDSAPKHEAGSTARRSSDGASTATRLAPCRRGLPRPARSPLIAFLRFQRAASPDVPRTRPRPDTLSARRSLDRPGLFHPENARELPPSGRYSARRWEPVSGLHSSHAVEHRAQTTPSASKD